ncbi:major facilitator superfamily domain-containing protein [Xylaria venustula]|nr:major facilitator superfamily domain-containing protein [Xylaria venustula]
MFGPILGPSVGPLAGGYLTDTLGWQWIFWTIAVVYGCLTIAQMLFMRETYPAVILERKTQRRRQETGNSALRSALDSGLSTRQVLVREILRPAKITVRSPVSAMLSAVSAYVNGVVFLVLTTAPVLFAGEYSFSARDVGLAFVGYGAGNLAGLAAFTLTSDRYVRMRAARHALRAEDRLLPGLVATPLLAVGLLGYGWSAASHAHWGLAIAGSAVIGAANVLFFSAVVGYLIDAFGTYAASAIAANVVLRSVGGSALPLIGSGLYAALGWGWGSSVLALLAALCAPVLVYVFVRGEAIRAKYTVQLCP